MNEEIAVILADSIQSMGDSIGSGIVIGLIIAACIKISSK